MVIIQSPSWNFGYRDGHVQSIQLQPPLQCPPSSMHAQRPRSDNINCSPTKSEVPSLDEGPPNPTPEGGRSRFLRFLLIEVHPCDAAKVHILRADHLRLADELISKQGDNEDGDRQVCCYKFEHLVPRKLLIWAT